MVSGSEELAVSRTASKAKMTKAKMTKKARKNLSQGDSGGEVKGGTP